MLDLASVARGVGFGKGFSKGDCKICKNFAKIARFCATICADR